MQLWGSTYPLTETERSYVLLPDYYIDSLGGTLLSHIIKLGVCYVFGKVGCTGIHKIQYMHKLFSLK